LEDFKLSGKDGDKYQKEVQECISQLPQQVEIDFSESESEVEKAETEI
jgi:hypothetical protein